ncbi:hypothetical protein BZG36_03748 [Bifiguratus adelaidae]|uniref:Uncharacterized protein n=1 Tax=Bifiguratus adelaidae TaxID=1938954 RepID=A0A261XYG0_9FUNG|nr:hypothetical protein BZG36_03748 [Bifiguratus adelaidae]
MRKVWCLLVYVGSVLGSQIQLVRRAITTVYASATPCSACTTYSGLVQSCQTSTSANASTSVSLLQCLCQAPDAYVNYSGCLQCLNQTYWTADKFNDYCRQILNDTSQTAASVPPIMITVLTYNPTAASSTLASAGYATAYHHTISSSKSASPNPFPVNTATQAFPPISQAPLFAPSSLTLILLMVVLFGL